MDNTRRLPISVNYAAGLCGLVAGMQALALVNFVYRGRVGYAALSLGMALVFLALMWGLRRGSRAAQVGTVVVGGLLALLGLLVTVSQDWAGLALLVPGLLLVLLLLVPVGARRYFARGHAQLGVG